MVFVAPPLSVAPFALNQKLLLPSRRQEPAGPVNGPAKLVFTIPLGCVSTVALVMVRPASIWQDSIREQRPRLSSPVNQVVHFVASDKEGTEREEAIAEYDRFLADLIRREMPLPPVVA